MIYTGVNGAVESYSCLLISESFFESPLLWRWHHLLLARTSRHTQSLYEKSWRHLKYTGLVPTFWSLNCVSRCMYARAGDVWQTTSFYSFSNTFTSGEQFWSPCEPNGKPWVVEPLQYNVCHIILKTRIPVIPDVKPKRLLNHLEPRHGKVTVRISPRAVGTIVKCKKHSEVWTWWNIYL